MPRTSFQPTLEAIHENEILAYLRAASGPRLIHEIRNGCPDILPKVVHSHIVRLRRAGRIVYHKHPRSGYSIASN